MIRGARVFADRWRESAVRLSSRMEDTGGSVWGPPTKNRAIESRESLGRREDEGSSAENNGSRLRVGSRSARTRARASARVHVRV